MYFRFNKKIYGYECDVYGHLNNSNYLQLLESARSEALTEMEVPIRYLREQGIQIFILRFELDYIKALQLEDSIEVRSYVRECNRLKAIWDQEIYDSSGALCFRARMTSVFARDGKAARIPVDLQQHFLKYI
ncbi:MAG: acyl-CoA thioesterase [Candidatus Cloacimonetes bacterium]|nr:acyl-CoA thioesterase [Candidatus Cloacimonadota bacterium]